MRTLITILMFCRKLMMTLNKCQTSLFVLLYITIYIFKYIKKYTILQFIGKEAAKKEKRSFSAQQRALLH